MTKCRWHVEIKDADERTWIPWSRARHHTKAAAITAYLAERAQMTGTVPDANAWRRMQAGKRARCVRGTE